jgi:hypothetical protein
VADGTQGRALTGPEQFWLAPRKRLVAAVCIALSVGIHYVLAPWSLLPEHELELRDTAGELAIPVDLLEGDNAPDLAPPPPVEPAPPPPVAAHVPGVGDALDGGAARTNRDAGSTKRPKDADADGAVDAARPPRPRPDASTPHHDAGPSDAASRDAGPHDAGAGKHEDAAVARAGQQSGPVRDAVGMIGAAGTAQAGPQNVVVAISMGVIRTHPVGARLGPLIAAIPQWEDFLVGTGVDPLRDTDWVSINGPSLIHSEHDVIIVRYSASDTLVDRALDVVGHKSGNGGPFDAGVPKVKAILGHADRADRVFMRPQAHVLAVVPPSYAATAAQSLARASIPRVLKHPNEALRMTLVHPHGPVPAIPESVTDLRLWIVPHNADGSADIEAEGDTASPEASRAAVSVLKAVVRDQNSFGVKLVTHGLLDGVVLSADGPTVRMHIPVTREQLEVLLAFAAGRLGVDITPRDAGAGGSTPLDSRPAPR